jgi:Family of unknown function (DUF5694)
VKRLLLLSSFVAVPSLLAQLSVQGAQERRLWGEREAKPTIVFLGLFHFAGERVDVSKTPPNLLPDMLSPRRQAELRDLRARLQVWRPTKIVVEWGATRQRTLDSTYAAYRAGGTEFRQMQGDPDELMQIALPLAHALGLERLYAVDTPNPQITTALTDSVHEARYAEQPIAGFERWDARYDTLTALRDTMRARSTLLDYLRFLNSDETQAKAVGRWLVATKRGTNAEPVGADGFITRYFVRNARIFSNIQRIIDDPNDRVLILYGNTHGYFLRQLFRASPEYRLRDAREVLVAPRSRARTP